MTLFVMCVGSFFGSILAKKKIIHPKMFVLIGGGIGIGGTWAISHTTNWTLFFYVFPICYGFMVGFTFMIHVYVTWLYFPGKEIYLTGVQNSGFGSGAFAFTFIASRLANPKGINPSKDIPD